MTNRVLLFQVSMWMGLLLGMSSCQTPPPSTPTTSPAPSQERVVIQLAHGNYLGVRQAALDNLQAYRSKKESQVPRYNFGRAATEQEIAAWDIDIPPDGTGLPPGEGKVADGAPLYALKCASCHGLKGEGIEPYYSALVAKESDSKTIGSYWPYATTLFDYIRRSMPYHIPGSLTDQEVYALTAFLLHANEIIAEDAVIDATSLPKIVMPNRDAFVPDDRENHLSKH